MVYDGHTDSEHPVPLLTLTETLDAARWLECCFLRGCGESAQWLLVVSCEYFCV